MGRKLKSENIIFPTYCDKPSHGHNYLKP